MEAAPPPTSECLHQGEDMRVQVRYEAHLSTLSLWDRENSCYIL